jgi:hypothetical protein
MGSRLTVLEEMPRHSGHRRLPKKIPALDGASIPPTQLEPESYAAGQTGLRLRLAGRNQGRIARALKRCRAEMGLQRMPSIYSSGRRSRSSMPNRGVLTALSPHEEVTLRRVAIGIAKLADLPARDIERLKVLLLVEENGGGLRLTPAGRERYLALPNSAGIFKPGTANENWFQMAELVSKGRR